MTQMMISLGFLTWMSLTPTVLAEGGERDWQTMQKQKSNTVRVNPRTEWAGYGSIVLRPAVYEPAKAGRKLTAKQEASVRAAVDNSLRAVFPEAGNRGGKTLAVQPVILEVRRANPWVNVVSFAAVQAPVSYGGATVRYELVDADTNTPVGEIASKRCAGPWNVYPWQMLQAFQPVGHAASILKRDAKMLRKDLDKIEGVQGPR